jgi:predicted NUDIX family NTP pyrophosphohydrolase
MRRSAGLLLFRMSGDVLYVLAGHMGGPFWAGKDAGAWSIPKGEHTEDEDPRAAARREFEEELGTPPPDGEWIELGEARQASGKRITAFAVPGDFDAARAVSNTFEMEWPRGSGRVRSFPEVDRAEWFDEARARTKLVRGQVIVLDRLAELLRHNQPDQPYPGPGRP